MIIIQSCTLHYTLHLYNKYIKLHLLCFILHYTSLQSCSRPSQSWTVFFKSFEFKKCGRVCKWIGGVFIGVSLWKHCQKIVFGGTANKIVYAKTWAHLNLKQINYQVCKILRLTTTKKPVVCKWFFCWNCSSCAAQLWHYFAYTCENYYLLN